MLLTRPNIAFSVQWFTQAIYKPCKAYLLTARNLLRYLKGTKDLAIAYTTIGNF